MRSFLKRFTLEVMILFSVFVMRAQLVLCNYVMLIINDRLLLFDYDAAPSRVSH